MFIRTANSANYSVDFAMKCTVPLLIFAVIILMSMFAKITKYLTDFVLIFGVSTMIFLALMY